MNTNELKKWIKDNNIEERTINGFWEYIKNYCQEVEDDVTDILNYIDINLLKIELRKASLSIIYNYTDVVNVYLDIFFNDKCIGFYEMVFTLTGEVTDDFFKVEDFNYFKTLVAIEDRNIEIAQLALKEGADIDFIVKITGMNSHQICELKKLIQNIDQ